MKADVIALGELLIDFATERTENGYPVMAAHPGGAPANFLAAVNAAGLSAAMLGKVGDDTFGKLLTGTLREAGIGTEGIRVDPSVFTTLAFVTLDAEGDRSFAFARKPGADTCLKAEELDTEAIDACRAFHFGTLSLTDEPARTATMTAVARAKEGGKLISFDPNLREVLWDDLARAKEAMLWGLERADIVKISDYEVEFLFGLSPEAGAEHILRTFGNRLVFVTCGAEGCIVCNRNARCCVPAYKAGKVVDTTGAGDIFGGSALAKVLQTGKAPEDLGEEELTAVATYAAAAAGLSVLRSGGISSVPKGEEVAAVLR
ncbi:MAG: carbohydrate kinase [Clostridia bacterium]|nr:carbohydrate kinase [Clostridia bacterium]